MRDELDMDPLSVGLAFITVKLPTILAASIMALLSFFLDSRKHSLGSAALAVFTGTALAVILTDPIVEYFHLSAVWGNAIAGILGISGRNLVMTINRIAKDPGAVIRIWRGDKDTRDE